MHPHSKLISTDISNRLPLTFVRYNAICSTAAAAGGDTAAVHKKKKKKASAMQGEDGAAGDADGRKRRKRKKNGGGSGSGSGGDGDSWYGGEEFDDLIDDRSGLKTKRV